MVKIELQSKDTSRTKYDFPTVITKRGLIEIKFDCRPSFNNNKYTMLLMQYGKNDTLLSKDKRTGTWKHGYTIGYDLVKDFYIDPKTRYLFVVQIYDENNNEIEGMVFIDYDE